MSIAEKIAALFAALKPEDLDAMPPASRRRFADTLKHWHQVAERQPQGEPRSGVLQVLRRGDRSP